MKKIFDTVFKGKNGDFKVLKREKDNCKIVFLNTGFETSANIRYIKDGSILANKGLPSVCGVGIVGKELKLELEKALYETWRQMLKRCYLENYAENHKKRGITVEKDWFLFTTFEKEVKLLEGWSEEDFLNKMLVFDKDKKRRIELELAKEYNKKNCTWIKKTENGLFTSKTRAIKATKENLEIKANSIKEMARKLKMNEKTVAKYLNSEYLGWKLEEIKIKR